MDKEKIMLPPNQTFMDLRTDYAFKRLFGSEQYKKIAIKFLNALFEGEFIIENIEFENKEILPAKEDGKRIVYDVFCRAVKKNIIHPEGDMEFDEEDGLSDQEHFIIEMQNRYEPLWESRAIFYTSVGISCQGRKGIEYKISPVFSIFIMNFGLDGMSKRLLHDIRFIDKDTKEIYSDDVRMLFLSLKEVKKEWSECNTRLEKMLYLIKNMQNMDKNAQAYADKDYCDIFEASEIDSLDEKDIIRYSDSYFRMQSDKRALDYAVKKAAKEALAEGEAKGRAEGEAKGRAEGEAKGEVKGRISALLETAKRLLSMKLDVAQISMATGLTEEQILALR